MADREIVSIVWHNLGHHIDVVYDEGEPDQVVGAQIVATQLAESVGLVLVEGPPGTIRWVRRPETSPARGDGLPGVDASSPQ